MGCVLLPSVCALCGSPLPLLSSAPICGACWAEVDTQTEPVCSRCSDALRRTDFLSGICRACRMAPPPFVRAVSYGPYEGRVRQSIHALKYDGLMPVAKRLGGLLARAIGELHSEAPGEMLVIPIPLHRSKFAQRGFNQARLLAVHALAALRETHPDWPLTLASSAVLRQRATGSQAGLTPRQRRLNVRGAFIVPDPKPVIDRDVLLIDDILTTGATVRAVARALIRAGAAHVWVATLARARHAFDDAVKPVPVESDADFRVEAGCGADSSF
jgi:ComF family protein